MGVVGDGIPAGGVEGANPCGYGEPGAIFSIMGIALPCAEDDAPKLDGGSTSSTNSPADIASSRSKSGSTRSAIELLAEGSMTAGSRGS